MSGRNFGLQPRTLGSEIMDAYNAGEFTAQDVANKINSLSGGYGGFIQGMALGVGTGFVIGLILLHAAGRFH